MLQRMLALAADVRRRYDTSSLRYIASSGSALGAPLGARRPEQFGPILHNIYGSTEVSLASVAGPEDLHAAPSTAGRPAPGSIVRILDDDGNEVPTGEVGRIFVGAASRFEGYTGGGGKEEIGGLLSSGDVGHFDEHGRLFVDGRDDDMIVSGGENVFPREVEDLLAALPARRRGRRHRRRRRAVRPAPPRLRRQAARHQADRQAGEGPRRRPPGPLQGARRPCRSCERHRVVRRSA